MRTLQDCREFAVEELGRTADGSDDPLLDFDALRTLCGWVLDVEHDGGEAQ